MNEDLAGKAVREGVRNPELMKAALALYRNELHEAEPRLKRHLKKNPFDVAAIRMLAELAGRIGRMKDAEALLRRAVELAPTFKPARSNLAMVLHRQGRSEEAISQLDLLIQDDPADMALANLKAAAAGRIGEFSEALALYENVLKANPSLEKVWMSYGHVLKTVGRLEDSVGAYRKALDLKPGFGEVWWSLANLKIVTFSSDDLTSMETEITHPERDDTDRFHLHFALGKAFEDVSDWGASFRHYDHANKLRRKNLPFNRDDHHRKISRLNEVMTPSFFEERSDFGCQDADPIFILGMPRAGSTLIEQILSSHSEIEGTQELPDIAMIANGVIEKTESAKEGRRVTGLADALAQLSKSDAELLGADYISRTQIHRKTGKAFFIDKMPNNWLYVGLIHLILPNAKIVDARRHPLDCGFSNFRQHYARGQAFSYDLEDIGHYYCDYVQLMKGLDDALPGRVHRVIHERLIESTKREVKDMLAYLNVPFDEACLTFWQTDRAIQTPSAEQVRRPINRSGVDRWKPYAEWLKPLERSLGDVLADYPAVPSFS